MEQIGLNENEEIDEAELEERIVIKALKDYNCSKFAQQHFVNIEAIINDVFQH